MNSSRTIRSAVVAGPIVALAIGAATSSVRDQVGATNVGVALAIVVVLAALASRGAGLLTAAAAALTFNFFHTEPYHSLRIHQPHDVVIVGLLLAIGLVVSDISSWRRRREVIGHRSETASNAPASVAAMLSSTTAVTDVWPTVIDTIMDQLTLANCRFQQQQPQDLPIISRVAARSAEDDDRFVLPSHGAAMAVTIHGRTIGFLVLSPQPGAVSLQVERRIAVALADHIALALSYGDQQRPAALTGPGVISGASSRAVR